MSAEDERARMVQRLREQEAAKARGLALRQAWALEEVARAQRGERPAEDAPSPETTRYRVGVEKVIAKGEKPTDERVAAELGLSPKTLGRWRRRGLLS